MFGSEWGSERWWVVAGWTMLHSLWVGGGFGLLAAIGRILIRSARPDVRYAFALSSLAAQVFIPLWIACRVAAVIPGEFERPEAVSSAMIAVDRLAVERDVSEGEVRAPSPPAEVAPVKFVPLGPVVPSGALASRVATAAGWLPWAWLAGTSMLLLAMAAGLAGSSRLRRHCRAIDRGGLPGHCERLAARIGLVAAVPVAICDRVAGPVLLGIVRPIILLPPAAMTGWSVEQLELVLLHELAHVRRRDTLVNLMQRFVEALLFFQPAVWTASRWVRLEREHCCDRIVVEASARPRAYAETLAAMASPGRSGVGLAAAMAEGPLVGRIRRILGVEDDDAGVSGGALAVLALTLAVPLAIVATLASRPEPPESGGDGAGRITSATPIEPPRYQFEAGRSITYDVAIEATGPDLIESYRGTASYRVLGSGPGVAVLEHSSWLSARRRTADGRPVLSGPFGGIDGSPTVHDLGGMGPAAVREVRVDRSGRVATSGGGVELPYLLGDLCRLALVPLAEDGRVAWSSEERRSVRVKMANPVDPWDVQTSPFPSPGFGMPRGFGRAPWERDVAVEVLPAVATSEFCIGGAEEAGIVPIGHRLRVETEPPDDGTRLLLTGTGWIDFDRDRGMPVAVSLDATLEALPTGPITLVLAARRIEEMALPGDEPERPAPVDASPRPSKPTGLGIVGDAEARFVTTRH